MGRVYDKGKKHFAHSVQLGWIFSLLVTSFSCAAGSRNTNMQSPPYPPSPVIKGVTYDWSTHQSLAPGSDNWPVTWGADDHQYTSWGDGGGFGGTNSESRVSLGVARLEGDWDDFTALNVWGGQDPESQADFGGKSYGILSIAGKLYMWVSPRSDYHNYSEARLAVSSDLGKTWSRLDWAFTQKDDLVLPTFIQFGRDYAGARDEFIYIYAIRLKNDRRLEVQTPGEIDLLRVHKDQLVDRDSYQYFAGLDENGEPVWADDLKDRQPVFTDPNGVGWTVSGIYNAGLGRYLLATEHGKSFEGNLGLFDAPEPWGPWTTVVYEQNWQEKGENFFWNFSNKWTHSDGKEFTLIYTGIGKNDSWNSVRGRFVLPESTPGPYSLLIHQRRPGSLRLE